MLTHTRHLKDPSHSCPGYILLLRHVDREEAFCEPSFFREPPFLSRLPANGLRIVGRSGFRYVSSHSQTPYMQTFLISHLNFAILPGKMEKRPLPRAPPPPRTKPAHTPQSAPSTPPHLHLHRFQSSLTSLCDQYFTSKPPSRSPQCPWRLVGTGPRPPLPLPLLPHPLCTWSIKRMS